MKSAAISDVNNKTLKRRERERMFSGIDLYPAAEAVLSGLRETRPAEKSRPELDIRYSIVQHIR
jgi:hypothetical protein